MSWNYRVLAHKSANGVYFQIHVVYYDDAGNAKGYAEQPEILAGESLRDMICDVVRMNLATKNPILKAWDFPNEYTP